MTSFDRDILIEPRRGKKEKRLPQQAILVVNPAEFLVARKCLAPWGKPVNFLNHTNLLVDKSCTFCLAGPALGAAAAGLVVEKLIALGVTNCLLLSCCGSIDPAWSIGDIVVAKSGVVGEGVSRHYGLWDQVAAGSEALGMLRQFLEIYGFTWQEGVVWSTDAPYRERRSELLHLQEKYGVGGIDMEYSALCSIAAFRGINIAGLFVISDELWGPSWRPGFRDPRFRNTSRRIIEHMIDSRFKKEGSRNEHISSC